MRYVDPTGHFPEAIGEYWNKFKDWFTGYDQAVTIDWQTELDTNIEKSLSEWNFSEETVIGDNKIREMVFENEVEKLKRKYLQIHKSRFPFELKVRQMKYDLKGLYAIEISDVPKLLHVATGGVSFGFCQGLAESVVSSAKGVRSIDDLINKSNGMTGEASENIVYRAINQTRGKEYRYNFLGGK